jgi:hypothetical protein
MVDAMKTIADSCGFVGRLFLGVALFTPDAVALFGPFVPRQPTSGGITQPN